MSCGWGLTFYDVHPSLCEAGVAGVSPLGMDPISILELNMTRTVVEQVHVHWERSVNPASLGHAHVGIRFNKHVLFNTLYKALIKQELHRLRWVCGANDWERYLEYITKDAPSEVLGYPKEGPGENRCLCREERIKKEIRKMVDAGECRMDVILKFTQFNWVQTYYSYYRKQKFPSRSCSIRVLVLYGETGVGRSVRSVGTVEALRSLGVTFVKV